MYVSVVKDWGVQGSRQDQQKCAFEECVDVSKVSQLSPSIKMVWHNFTIATYTQSKHHAGNTCMYKGVVKDWGVQGSRQDQQKCAFEECVHVSIVSQLSPSILKCDRCLGTYLTPPTENSLNYKIDFLSPDAFYVCTVLFTQDRWLAQPIVVRLCRTWVKLVDVLWMPRAKMLSVASVLASFSAWEKPRK